MHFNRRQILRAALASAGFSVTVITSLLKNKKVLSEQVDQEQSINHTAKLADVRSAKLVLHPIGTAPVLLEVVAQRSGFNWEVHISVVEHQKQPEYWPYRVVEIKKGSGWPPHAGIGPVILPTTIHTDVTHVGTKGIAVVGSNQTIYLDYQPS